MRLNTKNSQTQNWTPFDNITLSSWLKPAPTITTINTCYKNSHMATNPSTCLLHMTGRWMDALTSSSSLTLGFYSCGTQASINGSMRLTAGSPSPLALEVHTPHLMMASPLFATPLMSLRLKTAWLSRRVHTSRHRGACYRTEPQYLRSDTFIYAWCTHSMDTQHAKVPAVNGSLCLPPRAKTSPFWNILVHRLWGSSENRGCVSV